jgi:hypothetical protein
VLVHRGHGHINEDGQQGLNHSPRCPPRKRDELEQDGKGKLFLGLTGQSRSRAHRLDVLDNLRDGMDNPTDPAMNPNNLTNRILHLICDILNDERVSSHDASLRLESDGQFFPP